MKKSILVSLLVFLVLSCKPKQTAVNTHLDNKTERMIKGEWKVSSVSFPGSNVIKINSFDRVDSKCFEGSTWKFVSNNNTGEMALHNPNCTTFASSISWYVNENGEFVLKFLDGAKAKNVKEGYVLKIANQTETSFQLVSRVNLAGKATDLVYQFEKLN